MDILSKGLSGVFVICSGYIFVSHLETSVGVCGCCIQQHQIPVDTSSILLQHSYMP